MKTAALSALLVLFAAAPAAAKLRFGAPCGGNFECARLTVPLDRSGQVPGTVRLSIERDRAPGRRHEGAVFAIAGGPGQGASSVTEGFHHDLFGNVGTRDLIVIDQRGTGRSGALDCPELERPGAEPIDARTAACAERLGERRRFYTTQDSVEDIEAVRAALGFERITLLGVSYGTKVALNYAQRHPGRVERLVLDSVVPPEGQNPFDIDSFAAMPRVLDELCRGECRSVTPSLSADVAALVDRLPISATLIDGHGRRRTRTVTARDLHQQIRFGDTLADLRVDYPGVIRAALDGDPAPLVRLVHGGVEEALEEPAESQVEFLSFTLQAATLCEEAPLPWDRTASPEERDRQAAERAAALPDSAFEPFDRSAALTPDANNLLFQCRRWPAAPARPDPEAGAPLPDVPALVLAGLEDTRTPLEVGRRVAAAFPRAQVLAVPKTGHSVLGTAPCARTAVRRFFAGQALGSPCRSVRRAVRVAPVPPRSLAGVPGRSKAHRTLAAVRLTLRDLVKAVAFGAERGGGLRAGTFTQRGEWFVLRGYSFVPGVSVSGRVRGSGSDALRITGRAAARGTVRLRNGRLTGTLGGRPVTLKG